MPEQYAIAKVRPINRRHEGDPTVVEWPYSAPNYEVVELLAGPFDSLEEAKAVARVSIPQGWPSYR